MSHMREKGKTKEQSFVSSLLQASRKILEIRKFNVTARYIFDSCKDLIGASAGYIALLSKDGTENEVLFLDSGGLPCSVDPSLPMPIRGLRAEAYRTGKTVYDNKFSGSEWVKYIPERHVSLENVLFAPLVIEGKAVGLLGLANKPGGFNEDDARMATAFGELAAVALLNSRTLELLEEEKDRTQTYLDVAGVIFVVIDANQKVSKVNRKGCHILGYEENEIIGKNWFDNFIPERMKDEVKAVFARIMAGEVEPVEYFENPILTKGREERIIAWYNTTLRDKAGNITGTLSSGEDITERKKAEETLRESEEKLRIVTDTAQDAVIIVDNGGIISSWNKADEKIFGYAAEEAIGKYIHSLLAPQEFREACMKGFDSFRKTGQGPLIGKTLELSAVRKDGAEFPIELSISAVKLKGRWSATGIVRDITARRQMLNALQESENKFRNLAEKSLVGVYLIQDEIFKYANPMLAEIFGYVVDELTDKKGPVDLVLPEDWPVVRENLRKRLSGETESIHYEFRGIKKNGEIIYVDVYGSETVYQGRPAVVGTLLDITERKRAEKKIRQQREFLQKTMESLAHPFYVVDINDYTVIMANSASGFAVSPERKTCYALTHKKDRPCSNTGCLCPLETVKETKKPVTVEHTHYDEKGNPILVEIHGYPIFDETGKVIQMIEYVLDITERKKFEEEREKLIAELQDALAKVKLLSGMLPICASCKKIRDDKGYWKQIESYITEHSEALFSHGMCPECAKKAYQELDELIKKKSEPRSLASGPHPGGFAEENESPPHTGGFAEEKRRQEPE